MRTRLAASSTTAAAASGRNQQQQARRPGLWEEFHSVVRKKGFGTLYRGLQSTLWRDVPFASIYWFVMEHNKTKFGVYEHLSSSEQVAFAFVNGTVSSVVAVACTTPFDLVKSRQQAAGLQQSPLLSRGITQSLLCHRTLSLVQAAENREAMMLGSAGTFEYMKHIVRSEGVPGLWRGNVARMLRVVPGYAILISTYELGKQILVAE
jgi:solute carrier family 25 protein 39/40